MTRIKGEGGKFVRIPVEERFWSRFDKTAGPDGCWPWMGPRRKSGYGYTTDYWKKIYVHRLAYELTFGPIPPGMNVCHRCDNPPCGNPAHLWLGTTRDNALDMVRKGRASKKGAGPHAAKGERVRTAKLTEGDVRAIRAAYEPAPPGYPVGARWHKQERVTMEQLATRYGVTKSAIYAIVNRRTWKHVD